MPARLRPRVAARGGTRRHAPRGGTRRREAGIVTAELALGMIAFGFFLIVSLTAIGLGIDHVRCAEASRVGARLAARAESAAVIADGALAAAPAGSSVRMSASGSTVTVTVRAPERAIFARLGWDLAAVGRSVAPRERSGG